MILDPQASKPYDYANNLILTILGGSWVLMTPIVSLLIAYLEDLGGL